MTEKSSVLGGLVTLPLPPGMTVQQVGASSRDHDQPFIRELSIGSGPHSLGERDRITPLVELARATGTRFGSLWLEYPDTNEGKRATALCARLQPLLREAAQRAQLITADDHPRLPRLHVIFVSLSFAYVATSSPAWNSSWPMGIPRLRMPSKAPSRSVLKLAEAYSELLSEEERARSFQPGMRAVDLGAAPGGWSWYLSQRGLRVTAVDNAPLKGEVASDPLVEHLRTDGFHYRPRRPVHWLVCDMLEQPSRVAQLVSDWMVRGDAAHAIFNLKLPMKKRYEELQRCRHAMTEKLGESGRGYTLRFKQLYHDREEVTGYCTTSPS